LIIHDESRKDYNFTSSIDDNIVQITLTGFDNLFDLTRANLRNLILKKFLNYLGDSKGYEENISARLKSLQEFTEFAASFQAYRNKNREMEE
jgi:hypothetical protein